MNDQQEQKILYIADQLGGGSAESLLELVQSQQTLGTKPLIAFGDNNFVSERFQNLSNPVPMQRYYFRSWLTYGLRSRRWDGPARWMAAVPYHAWNIGRLLRNTRRHKTQMIHSNCIHLIEGGIMGKLLGLPHVWHVRELLNQDHYQYHINKNTITRVVNQLATLVLCNSKQTAKGLRELGVDENKLRVLYNIVEPPKSDEAKDLHQYLELDSQTQLVGIVGWLTPLKKIHQFIEMASKLADLGDTTRFLIIGPEVNNSEYTASLKKMIAENPNSENIMLTGTIKQAAKYLGSLDVLVSLCEIESFGRTVAEAIAAGTPAIGIKGSAVEEIITHGETGYLVEPNDMASLVNHVKRLLTEEAITKNTTHSGPLMITKKFGRDVIGAQLKDLYSEAIEIHKNQNSR
jgi:glycosyltransferase involved in cell wall biosynthesis